MAIVLNGSSQYAHAALTFPSNNAQGPTTIACFVKPTTPSGTWYPIALYDTSQPFWMLAARGEVSPNLSVAGRARTIVESITTYTTITDNAWIPVVITNATDGTCTAYVGTTTGVSANNGTQSAITYEGVCIGAFLNQGSSPQDYLNGKVAYAMVYNRVWDSAEIGTFINATTIADIDSISTTSREDRWDLIDDGNSDAAGTNLTVVGTPTFDSDNPLTAASTAGVSTKTLERNGVAVTATTAEVKVWAGTSMTGAADYENLTATITSGVLQAIDLSATSINVSDNIVVGVWPDDGPGIIIQTTAENIA